MPQILVLGEGMLGWMLARRLSRESGVTVRQTQRRDPRAPLFLDAAEAKLPLEGVLTAGELPDLIVNAIGITKDRIDEEDPASVSRAEKVNGRFVQRLSEAARKHRVRVVHISTDGVFLGRKEPYDESCRPDATDAYGRSKAAGEAASPSFLVIRCSIIGPEPRTHRGLFEKVRSLPERSSINGFTDHIWNGVTTLQFSELCLKLLGPRVFDSIATASPLRHLCPNPTLSKCELVRLLSSALGTRLNVTPVKAPAPLCRILSSKWTDLNSLIPTQDWQQTLNRLVTESR